MAERKVSRDLIFTEDIVFCKDEEKHGCPAKSPYRSYRYVRCGHSLMNSTFNVEMFPLSPYLRLYFFDVAEDDNDV